MCVCVWGVGVCVGVCGCVLKRQCFLGVLALALVGVGDDADGEEREGATVRRGKTSTDKPTRVWWSGAGLGAFLPFHAAGDHHPEQCEDCLPLVYYPKDALLGRLSSQSPHRASSLWLGVQNSRCGCHIPV